MNAGDKVKVTGNGKDFYTEICHYFGIGDVVEVLWVYENHMIPHAMVEGSGMKQNVALKDLEVINEHTEEGS